MIKIIKPYKDYKPPQPIPPQQGLKLLDSNADFSRINSSPANSTTTRIETNKSGNHDTNSREPPQPIPPQQGLKPDEFHSRLFQVITSPANSTTTRIETLLIGLYLF